MELAFSPGRFSRKKFHYALLSLQHLKMSKNIEALCAFAVSRLCRSTVKLDRLLVLEFNQLKSCYSSCLHFNYLPLFN
jgi:hypothetical protein